MLKGLLGVDICKTAKKDVFINCYKVVNRDREMNIYMCARLIKKGKGVYKERYKTVKYENSVYDWALFDDTDDGRAAMDEYIDEVIKHYGTLGKTLIVE